MKESQPPAVRSHRAWTPCGGQGTEDFLTTEAREERRGSYYKTYKMKKPGSGDYSFVFNDIMGLEKGDGGVHVEELMLAMEGHVEEGYEFTSAHQLKEGDPGYQPNPTLADKVHVLVFVVPVPSVDLIDEKLVKKMREVRLAAADLGIPQMAILTKPDEFCEKVKSNPENVYWSTRIKEQVDKFHLLLGLQENAIFPVKNFSSEITPTKAINMQILFPLQMMINLGEDYLNSL
ncbi:interferon-induced protein 44-like isoform 2-T2 [Pholidichthys leucotaenia]